MAAFPQEFRRRFVLRKLRPGAVVKLVATMDDGKPHEKRFVVLDCSGDLILSAVFNSEIHPFIQKNAVALKCQVECAPPYEFVTKLCFLDCSRVRKFDLEEAIGQLVGDPSWMLGDIDGSLRDQIVAALKASISISPADLNLCLASLEGIEFPDAGNGRSPEAV